MIGEQFGRWTVIGNFILTPKGERKWLCRCTCGTERYVLERSLRCGGSTSCGCLRKEEAAKAVRNDLEGKTFGDLTVLGKSEAEHNNGGIWWRCRCACGETYECPGTLLVTGRRTHCGSNAHKGNYRTIDITGKRFQRLTALYPMDQRDRKGSVIWHCRCDCGNEVDVSYNNLMYTTLSSCGCRMKEHVSSLSDHLTRVAGTSLDILKSRKVPVNNTTGYRGVYFIRGKYVAKINFQKKAYYLGAYDNIESAIAARKSAVAQLFDGTASFYERWKERADADPEWAQRNPIQISVTQRDTNDFSVELLPALDEKYPVR